MKKLEKVLGSLIEISPDVPVGYISENPLFRETIKKYTESIGGDFKEVGVATYMPNRDDRSVEYVFVEDIASIENGLSIGYNVLESVGLLIAVVKEPFDIWEFTKKCGENFLSDPTSIELEDGYHLITSKKLLRS